MSAQPTPWLTKEWQQMALDSLRAMLDVDADTRRQMIEWLLKEGIWDRNRLTWEAAVSRWNANLNPAKPDKFSLMELWALAKRFDRHELALAMIVDLGYEVPRRKTTAERQQELLERIAAAVERNNAQIALCAHELAGLGIPVRPLRVHPAIAGGIGAFSQPDSPDERPGF